MLVRDHRVQHIIPEYKNYRSIQVMHPQILLPQKHHLVYPPNTQMMNWTSCVMLLTSVKSVLSNDKAAENHKAMVSIL